MRARDPMQQTADDWDRVRLKHFPWAACILGGFRDWKRRIRTKGGGRGNMSKGRALRVMALLLLLGGLGLFPGTMLGPGVALAAPDFEIAMDYPSIAVEPGKTVSLSLRLINKAKVGRQMDLSISTSPTGWQSNFKDSVRGYGVRSVYVGPEETKTVSFEAVPPDDVKPGDFTFVIRAQSRDGIDETLTVSVAVVEKTVSGTKVVSQYPVLRG